MTKKINKRMMLFGLFFSVMPWILNGAMASYYEPAQGVQVLADRPSFQGFVPNATGVVDSPLMAAVVKAPFAKSITASGEISTEVKSVDSRTLSALKGLGWMFSVVDGRNLVRVPSLVVDSHDLLVFAERQKCNITLTWNRLREEYPLLEGDVLPREFVAASDHLAQQIENQFAVMAEYMEVEARRGICEQLCKTIMNYVLGQGNVLINSELQKFVDVAASQGRWIMITTQIPGMKRVFKNIVLPVQSKLMRAIGRLMAMWFKADTITERIQNGDKLALAMPAIAITFKSVERGRFIASVENAKSGYLRTLDCPYDHVRPSNSQDILRRQDDFVSIVEKSSVTGQYDFFELEGSFDGVNQVLSIVAVQTLSQKEHKKSLANDEAPEVASPPAPSVVADVKRNERDEYAAAGLNEIEYDACHKGTDGRLSCCKLVGDRVVCDMVNPKTGEKWSNSSSIHKLHEAGFLIGIGPETAVLDPEQYDVCHELVPGRLVCCGVAVDRVDCDVVHPETGEKLSAGFTLARPPAGACTKTFEFGLMAASEISSATDMPPHCVYNQHKGDVDCFDECRDGASHAPTLCSALVHNATLVQKLREYQNTPGYVTAFENPNIRTAMDGLSCECTSSRLASLNEMIVRLVSPQKQAFEVELCRCPYPNMFKLDDLSTPGTKKLGVDEWFILHGIPLFTVLHELGHLHLHDAQTKMVEQWQTFVGNATSSAGQLLSSFKQDTVASVKLPSFEALCQTWIPFNIESHADIFGVMALDPHENVLHSLDEAVDSFAAMRRAMLEVNFVFEAMPTFDKLLEFKRRGIKYFAGQPIAETIAKILVLMGPSIYYTFQERIRRLLEVAVKKEAIFRYLRERIRAAH